LDFDAEGRMRVVSRHPGVSVDQIRENTGFDLVIPADVPETPPPTSEELRLLRTRVDRRGWLRAKG